MGDGPHQFTFTYCCILAMMDSERPTIFCPLTLERYRLAFLTSPCAQRHTEAIGLFPKTPVAQRQSLLQRAQLGSGQQQSFVAKPAFALTCKILRFFGKKWSKPLLCNLFPEI